MNYNIPDIELFILFHAWCRSCTSLYQLSTRLRVVTPGQIAVTPGQSAVTPGQIAVTPGQSAVTTGQIAVTPGQSAVTQRGNPMGQLVTSTADLARSQKNTAELQVRVINLLAATRSGGQIRSDFSAFPTPHFAKVTCCCNTVLLGALLRIYSTRHLLCIKTPLKCTMFNAR